MDRALSKPHSMRICSGTRGGYDVAVFNLVRGASKGQVWIRHLAPAAPAFTRPSSPNLVGEAYNYEPCTMKYPKYSYFLRLAAS